MEIIIDLAKLFVYVFCFCMVVVTLAISYAIYRTL